VIGRCRRSVTFYFLYPRFLEHHVSVRLDPSCSKSPTHTVTAPASATAATLQQACLSTQRSRATILLRLLQTTGKSCSFTCQWQHFVWCSQTWAWASVCCNCSSCSYAFPVRHAPCPCTVAEDIGQFTDSTLHTCSHTAVPSVL
jgi:hypothetical protein